ncbi:MAG TPA: choice-of-anchor Q domain-containing protein [Flavisolibacter sp.]|nr:choice-of-anchor Q domain-containing protein [Flavisolibacter sp.]
MKFSLRNLSLISVLVLIFLSCKKEGITNNRDAILRTDVDTLHFDTVFTTTGSTSQVFKIFNPNNKGVRINSVRLAGGVASPFKINVDGITGPEASNIEIASGDSAYVFVTVKIDPSGTPLPFVVRDSVELNYNGNTSWVQLDAYGRNAHFLRNSIITANTIWTNDLPYVILGNLTVATGTTLSIQEGCQVFMHANAPFIVNGTLQVNGDKFDSTRVVFTGDRLDDPYRDFPASFPGLIFTETSTNNSISYAIIKNAYQGIVALESDGSTKLTLNETIIDNAYDAGIFGIHTSIRARNVLISNCGKNILLVKGGNYDFTHCTVASISNNFIQHKEPLMILTDYLKENNSLVIQPLTAQFTNCIFWAQSGGLVKNEILVDKQGFNATVKINNALLPSAANLMNIFTSGNIITEDPLFENIMVSENLYSFRLKENSPAINKGSDAGVIKDLDGKPRPVGLPDLGAYERQ